MRPVRLNQKEIDSIITNFEAIFGNQDELWLFGSCVDLAKRGGDIDLFIKTAQNDDDLFDKKMNQYY